MTDFLANNSLYVVLLIALMIWVGIGTYLFMLDLRISKIEKHLKDEVDMSIKN